jgi:HTH-type transcriptional regulator/antitoxin HigA
MKMNVRPIKTEADYDWALKEIARYFDVQPKPGTAEGDRFDVLATLIEAYEEKHWPIDPPDPVDAIKYRMEQAGLGQADLARLLGSRSRASEIMRRKRSLTMEQALKLNEEWKIPAEALLRPSLKETAWCGTLKRMAVDRAPRLRKLSQGKQRKWPGTRGTCSDLSFLIPLFRQIRQTSWKRVGVEFIDENGGGPGVRLCKRSQGK